MDCHQSAVKTQSHDPHLHMMKRILTILFLVACTGCAGCASLIHSVRLPISVRVVNAETMAPVIGADVELQWRSGFQGYYWGRPVHGVTDDSGKVKFMSQNIPPVSSDGYDISTSPLRKVFVSCILVRAKGYETLWIMNPEKFEELRLKPERHPGKPVVPWISSSHPKPLGPGRNGLLPWGQG